MNPISKLERFFACTVVVGIITLVLVQGLTRMETGGIYSNVKERLYREPADFYAEYPEARVTSGTYHSVFSTITIQCENFSSLEKAVLLVNGEEVGDFRDKQITIKVSPGDIVSIDGSFYVYELVFKVVAASENVGQPEIGQIIRVQGDVALVGEVRMK